MDFDVFFAEKSMDPKKNPPLKQVELDHVFRLGRKTGEIDLGISIQSEEIFSAQADLDTAVPGGQLILHNHRKVDGGRFVSQPAGSFQIDVTLDIIDSGKTVLIIFFLSGG